MLTFRRSIDWLSAAQEPADGDGGDAIKMVTPAPIPGWRPGRLCIRATRSGGKCVLVGIGAKSEATIPLGEATGREVDLLGVFRYCNLYQTAVDLVAAGRIQLQPLITHHFSLAETPQAFHAALRGGDAIKARVRRCATACVRRAAAQRGRAAASGGDRRARAWRRRGAGDAGVDPPERRAHWGGGGGQAAAGAGLR